MLRLPRPFWLAALSLLGAGFILDHVERFFQGDSVSYLGTDGRHLPTDRSWLFGLAVTALVRLTGSEYSFMALQALLLLLVLMACAPLFAEMPGGRRAHAAFVVICCLDPLIGLYTRFYMTDLLAGLLFLLFLVSLHGAVQATRAGFRLWLPALALTVMAAVFIRVAYAAITLLSVVFLGFAAARLRLPVMRRLMVAVALPFLAVVALAGANRIVFAEQFPGEFFVNKLSGVFALGIFAPALDAGDFRAAGVDVSDADVAALRLADYDRRGDQIWGTDDTDAQALIKHRLGLAPYSQIVDRTCARIVAHALWRNPLGFLQVYATTLLFHFEPSEWRKYLDVETGVARSLPQGFVDMMNRLAKPRIAPGITAQPSLMLDAFLWVAPLYPLLLAGTALAAGWHLLLGRQTNPGCLIASAGFLAVVAAGPLYAVYVIPRYMIAAVPLAVPVWAGLDWPYIQRAARERFPKVRSGIVTM